MPSLLFIGKQRKAPTDPADPSEGIRPCMDLDPWDGDSYGLVVSYHILVVSYHIIQDLQMSTMLLAYLTKILYVMHTMMSWNGL